MTAKDIDSYPVRLLAQNDAVPKTFSHLNRKRILEILSEKIRFYNILLQNTRMLFKEFQ